MHGGPYNMDEVARRRAARMKGKEEDWDEQEPEIPKMGWKDVVAMTIAAYQLIFPMLLVLFAVFGVVYLLFKWWAH